MSEQQPDQPRHREPWERGWADHERKESVKAFEAFALYRDLGPEQRSMSEVACRLSKSRPLITRWSSRFRWVERVDAYDHHNDEQRRHAAEAATIAMVERHAREAAQMQLVSLEPTRVLLQKIEAGELDLSKLKAKELMSLARLGVYGYTSAMRAERVARGLTERGPIEAKIEDESSEELTAALNRLAEVLGVPPEDVIDEVAAKRSERRRASGE